jgi:hypothetical protein
MSEEIKEDFLEVDSKIPGQNYVCLSFVSPEKILKKKEIFFASQFLNYLINDNDAIVQEVREKMLNKDITVNYDNVEKLYEDWKYLKNEDLEAQFFELNDYKTSMRGLKVRGVYDSHKEASVRAQLLRRRDPSFNVFVGQVGYWLPWDPECESVPEQEYQEGQLNELVKKYKENLDNRDNLYDQLKNERIEKAKKEVDAKKELIKAQNQANASNNVEEDTKNIEKLREIVDESDRLFYENLKKQQSGEQPVEESAEQPVEESVEKPAEQPVEEQSVEQPVEEQPDEEQPDEEQSVEQPVEQQNLNNFKAEKMESLEEEDPWLSRKKEQ